MANQTISFTKMHGLGNDFIVIYDETGTLALSEKTIRFLANRHLGIGCDQLLIIKPALNQAADFVCKIFNPDGSEAEQCGNGLRCIARYLHEKHLIKANQVNIQVLAGIFPITIHDYDHIDVTLTIAEPEIRHLQIPSSKQSLSLHTISLGNPHAVLVTDDLLNEGEINQLATEIQQHPSFSSGVNIGFAYYVNHDTVRLRTHERGAGLTHACGSNACATALISIKENKLSNPANVEFDFGSLTIHWDETNHSISMSGPASKVFDGTISI